MLRFALAFVVSVTLTASPAAALAPAECADELAAARKLYDGQKAKRLRLADPLARAVRQVIERTVTDDDRALVARFSRGEATAAEVDRALWPKLHPALDRFNRAGCRDRGGVVRTEEMVEASTALRGGKGLHTGVVVECARQPLQGETRRFLALRVMHGERGPVLALFGFVQERATVFASQAEAEWSGFAVSIPLGDRVAEGRALETAVASYTGSEDDFTWAVPRACRTRLSLAP